MQIENFRDKTAAIEAIPQLCAVWNEAFGPHWPLAPRLLHQCFADDPYFEPSGFFVAREKGAICGWILSKTNRAGGAEIGRFAGRGGIGAWCVATAHQNRGIGAALLVRAEKFLRAAEVAPNTLYFPHHLLPGVPAECVRARRILETRGYAQSSTHFDLRRDLHNWEMPAKARAAIDSNPTVQLRPAREDEREAICDFVAREFPGAWTYTTRGHFARGGAASDMMIAVEENEVIGFCHTADARSARLIASTYWSSLFGENFGGLGPIGIARAHRKRGLGLALCAAAVENLTQRGTTAMGIDWTTLVDFYEQLGFEVWKTYAQYDASL